MSRYADDAHSTFFKHYLAIVSIPITAIIVIVSLVEKSSGKTDRIVCYGPVPSVALTIVWLIGFMVMGYIINLRLDAILYARVVNSVRKFFVEQPELTQQEAAYTSVLPTDAKIPPYHEPLYFGWVVIAFAVIDSTYLALAVLAWNLLNTDLYNINLLLESRGTCAIIMFAVSVLLHYIVYVFLCNWRSKPH